MSDTDAAYEHGFARGMLFAFVLSYASMLLGVFVLLVVVG